LLAVAGLLCFLCHALLVAKPVAAAQQMASAWVGEAIANEPAGRAERDSSKLVSSKLVSSKVAASEVAASEVAASEVAASEVARSLRERLPKVEQE
jgi:hypothetical protein